MRHPARCVVLAACLAVAGSSVADAAPTRRHGKVSRKAKDRAAVAPHAIDLDDIELDDADDDEVQVFLDDDEEDDRDDDGDRYKDDDRYKDGDRYKDDDRYEDDDRYDDDDDASYDDDRAGPRRARGNRRRGAARAKDWHLAIGPYLWASSVEADIAIGSASVGSGVDFMDMTRNARFGVEVLAEARYRRFAITTDFMYGVIDLNGDKEVGPLMVGLNGTAASLLVDGAAGYMVTGGDHALLSVEARAGVRYQRTTVSGAVGIGGSEVASTEQVMAGADALVGARVFLRPFRRYSLSSTVDVGVVGSSTLTWSAAADASVRVHPRVLLSLGWRTLTMESTTVSLVMHGPRAAVQLLF